jgi:hypothetical protein
MKKLLVYVFLVQIINTVNAQTDSAKSEKKILLVPYSSMMYFSDADPDIARGSRISEPQLRNQMRVDIENNTYHQLLSAFNVVSIINATSLNAEDDLKKIYAATRYILSSNVPKDKSSFSSNIFNKKTKKQTFHTTDSATMIAEIQDPQLYSNLQKTYHHDYILYLTQFEINTSNKNTIEWMKQNYNRTYTLHYNIWDNTGKLILAETMILSAGGENNIKDIKEKYITEIAQKLKYILKNQLH